MKHIGFFYLFDDLEMKLIAKVLSNSAGKKPCRRNRNRQLDAL